jgi:hypothetical protein
MSFMDGTGISISKMKFWRSMGNRSSDMVALQVRAILPDLNLL